MTTIHPTVNSIYPPPLRFAHASIPEYFDITLERVKNGTEDSEGIGVSYQESLKRAEQVTYCKRFANEQQMIRTSRPCAKVTNPSTI